MSRITQLLTGRGERKLLVPFLTVGYPDRKTMELLCREAVSAGADMLELGIPFSDPLADGPQVQLSSHLALQQGVTLDDVFDTAEQIRSYAELPLITMGYYNPIYAYGIQDFMETAVKCGIDGIIVPDLPPEEASYFIDSAQDSGISVVFLVAPTSTRERVKIIEKCSTDFVYAVTVTGVTGAGKRFDSQTDQYLSRLRKQLHKPFVAGFGVSSGESAVQLCRYADGVVIGSALIKQIEEMNRSAEAVTAVGKLLGSVRNSLGE